MSRFAALLLAATLTACSLDPDDVRGPLPIAAQYPAGPAYQQDSKGEGANSERLVSADKIAWRDFFTDQRLQALIALAIVNNPDLRNAALNVGIAEAQYRVQRADLFPSIGVTASGDYESLPSSTAVPTSTGSGAASGTTSTNSGTATGSTQSTIGGRSGHQIYRYTSISAGFTSYELDLFGRLQSLTRAAFETYLGLEETRRAAQITLVAEVATDYLTMLADQELLRLSEATLASQSDSYRLTKMMLDNGTTTLLTLRQVEQTVDTAKANCALYSRQLAQDENALTLLLGTPPPTDLPPGKGLDDQGLLTDLPAGLPSDLLTRRPDILAAEHTLLSDNADIGAARAAFFPSITLTASDGVASNSFNHLFTSGATNWLFSPQINIPIFTWGKNQGNLDADRLTAEQALVSYNKAIQTAFREVADGLAARGTYGRQLQSEQALTDAAADSYRLAMMRFRAGVDNFLTALDSQRTLYSAQQELVTIRQAQLTNLVTLYKVLGGGWTAPNQTDPAPE
jgi:multidrug efflux system outer membrane protein